MVALLLALRTQVHNLRSVRADLLGGGRGGDEGEEAASGDGPVGGSVGGSVESVDRGYRANVCIPRPIEGLVSKRAFAMEFINDAYKINDLLVLTPHKVHAACGVRRAAGGGRRAACGGRRAAGGGRRAAGGRWRGRCLHGPSA